jgi:YVTN family beta-propeller protein
MTARSTSAALAGLALAALVAASALAAATPATPGRPGSAPLTEVRGVGTLPSLADAGRVATPLNAIVSKSDTFLVSSHGFDDLAGQCQTRGWTGEDRTRQIFTHVVSDKTVNQAFFTGLIPVSGQDNLTGDATTTRIWGSYAVATTDSGVVVFADEDVTHRLFAVYPGQSAIRSYGVWPAATGKVADLAYDPATHRMIACGALPTGLYAFAGNGDNPALLGGTGTVTADTTLLAARIEPRGLVVDPLGNIYIAEYNSNRVRVARADGRVVTIAGTGTPGFGGDGGPATAALLFKPIDVALDPSGTQLYIADSGNNRIRVVQLATGVISTLYGDGTMATLTRPQSIAYSGGALWITLGTAVVSRLAGGVLTTRAGGAGFYAPAAGSSDALQQTLGSPQGLAADGAGGVYFTDLGLRLAFHLDAGGALSAVAGVSAPIAMGGRSLWFGADMASHPAEVGDWVRTSGYGNGWNQRLTSPEFSFGDHPGAVLRFDGSIRLVNDAAILANSVNAWVMVQGLNTSGNWTWLRARITAVGGDVTIPAGPISGRGRFKGEVRLNGDGNDAAALASLTRLRFMVQTLSSGSNEDGLGPDQPDGALVLDNITLQDGDFTVIPPTDFEGGTTGGWTLSALNGSYVASGMVAYWFRDLPAPEANVALKQGFDFTDPSCVWTFLAPGDSVNHRGLHARLTSPWFAMAPGDTQLLIAFSGKLATRNNGRVLNCWVRGKETGDTRPRFASPTFFSYNSGTYGNDDVSAPYVTQRVLNYPADFQYPHAADSLQIVFFASDQTETLDPFFFPPGETLQPTTRLPYLDDIRLYQLGVDRDHDGVADAVDACPDSCAAGQDANADGCVDPTATMRHVESWAQGALPLHYRISALGDPRITDGSDFSTITNGFAAWAAVPGTNLQVVQDPPTSQTNASAYDGVNLVTFQDEYSFPPNVIGITPTLSALRRAAYDDRIVLPGQIVDADMILNPAVPFRTPSHNPSGNSIDLQSVVTHEAGHFFGLSHSGVLNSTMFFVLQPGTGAASLEADDRAAIAAAYPAPSFATDFATITGQVLRGGGTGPGGAGYAIPGALVTAVQIADGAPTDSVASDYTDEGGNYALRGLAPGTYSVRVTPLDGEMGGYALTPDYISARLKAVAQTNFSAEWWSQPETDRDPPDLRGTLTLAAGEVRSGIQVITNVDTIPPTVVAVSPGRDTTDIRIDTSILVNFSERIDSGTLQGNFRLHIVDSTNALGGGGTLVNGGRNLVFAPTNTLLFGTRYQLDVTTGVTDREGVHLADPFTTRFTTQDAPPVAITDVRPRAASPGSFITILGTGFDPGQPDSVQFDAGPGHLRVPAASVTPTTVLVRVPGTATTGPLYVVIFDQVSNPFAFTVLPPLAQTAPSHVMDVDLSFAPADVALGPAGDTAYAVGSGGLAVIDLQTLDVLDYGTVGAAQSLALTPDGKRAVVTRPATGDVVTVDVAHGSGTFGQVLGTTTLPAGATPQGVAIAPTGRAAFVTDPGTRLVYRVDIDPLSATRYCVLDEIADTTVALTGGIATSPDGKMLYYGTNDAGVRGVRLPGHVPMFVDQTPSTGGVAVDPAAHEVLFARAGAMGANLFALTVLNDTSFTPQVIPLGGDIRDVAYNKDGNAAYVVNSATSQLLMVSVDPDDPNYHGKIAEVATGSTPVAVAVSGFGDVIAVANYGSRSLSLYRIGGSAALLRAVPDVARPGDVVALIGSGIPFGTGSQVDVGSGLFAPERRAAGGNGAAFVVPAGPQRDALVAAVDSLGMRTLGLPLRVVDPVTSMAPKSTGFTVRMDSAFCGLAGDIWGQMEAMRLSPDGRYLAVARDLVPGECGIWLELFQVTDDGPARLGAKAMPGLFVAPPGDDILGLDFTPDGKQVWVAHMSGPVNVVDTDPSSLTYGTIVSTVSMPQTGTSSAISADPLGRCMVVGDRTRDSLAIFDLAGKLLAKVQTPGPTWATAITPDGRYVVTAGGWRTGIVDLEARALFSTSPTHGSSTNPDYMIAIPTDGKRAVVTYPYPYGVGIYNLDPAAGPVGGEIFYGTPLSSSYLVTSLAPAPDGHGVLAASSDHDSLVYLDPRTTPPTLSWIPTPAQVRRFAASADGRRLWIGTHTPGYPGPGAAAVGLYSLSGATSLALVSGGGQSGLKSAFLSQPLRFRATDGSGNPQVGAVLRFDGVSGLKPILDAWDTPLWHVTDVNGEVSVKWMLSSVPGTDSLVVGVLGVPGVSLLATAQVVVADSVLPPALLSLGPANGATGLSAGTAVSATFNKGMDSASVVAKLKLFAGPNAIAGGYRASADRKTVFFQPVQPLAYAARCSLVVESGIQDRYGLTTAQGATSVFTIQAPPALAITSLSPPAATTSSPIVISGQGFSPIASQNTVLFNGVLATVTSASATSIVANVPLAATTGPVTVQVGSSNSNALTFVVLEPNASPGGVVNNLPASQGVRDVAITSDGNRAYVTNPASNSVTALDIPGTQTITSVTVGLEPQGVALLPDDSRAYVANTGSNDVSVIDIRPASADYHKVVATITVGSGPVDIAVSAIGPKVIVVNSGSKTVSLIDGNPGNATFNQVTAQANVGSSGQSVVISPDGARAFVATSGGTVVVIDVNTGAVTAQANVGSSGQSVAISPDGTILLVLCTDGTIKIVDVAPGSPSEYQVTASANVGSSGQSVVVSPDGALAYVTNGEGNAVLVFSITASGVSGAASISPSPAVVLTLIATIPVGQSPAGIAVDPSHGAFVLACNSGSGTVSVIAVATGPPPVPAKVDLEPDRIVLAMLGHWETGFLQPEAPFQASDIVLRSVRLDGVVPADTTQGGVIGDHDHDGVPDLAVKFDRKAVALAVPDGDHVPVTVTGTVGTRRFVGTDTIRVVRFDVSEPAAGSTVWRAHPYTVRWQAPRLLQCLWVAVLHSFDHGATWRLDATHQPNTGSYVWAVPDTACDSVLVAVVLVERDDSNGTEVYGVLGVSDPFRVGGVLDVDAAPLALAFAPIRPNPAAGRALMRFGLPHAAEARLEVFDIQGRRVQTLADGWREAGWYDVQWSGRNETGGRAGPGLYLVRLRSGGREFRQRMVWLR